MSVLPGDRFLTSTTKRLGEECFFSGAFVVFYHISAIFRAFCLVILGNFVNLHTVKGVATICYPDYLNVNKLEISRNALNLNLLRLIIREIDMQRFW
jgi:hypothetical protein